MTTVELKTRTRIYLSVSTLKQRKEYLKLLTLRNIKHRYVWKECYVSVAKSDAKLAVWIWENLGFSKK